MTKSTIYQALMKFLARIWYPVALPEDLAEVFEIEISNFVPYPKLLETISGCQLHSHRLAKYMPRKLAESVFRHATCVETFKDKSIASYYFHEGWIEFVLYFDQDGALRRIYLLHKEIPNEMGVELPLNSTYVGSPPYTISRRKQRMKMGPHSIASL
jgi:hypothetical protein